MLYQWFYSIYSITMDMAAIYMAGCIGYHMGVLEKDLLQEKRFGTIIVSLGCYFLLAGVMQGNKVALGAKGMFLAIISAGLSSAIYIFISKRMKRRQLLADGADMNLWSSIDMIFPITVTFASMGLANNLILKATGAGNMYELLSGMMSQFFEKIGNGFAGGFTYTFMNSFLWFFGVHGSDVLESAAETLFQSTGILTRPFINNYVSIGGSGATLCLFIALLFVSKRRGTRKLMKISALPMIFNINEIMVFGLPIIYNPVFWIPFILVPVVNYTVSYGVMSLGLVPEITNEIQWTTPILLNGYLSTGSIKGVLLQLVNVAIGVVIYAPFVRLYDKTKASTFNTEYEYMLERLKESEESRTPIRLTSSERSFGWMGKALAADLEYAFEHDELKLFYQPQYNHEEKCVGAEALLRWKHHSLGWIYPPMIIKLAEEIGIQEKLEKWVIKTATEDANKIRKEHPDCPIKISVNVTGAMIQKKSFAEYLLDTAKQNHMKELGICIEITEQDALLLDDTLRERFLHLREAGYILAVDDFSMGSTSIGYLTDSHFELLKLDGKLVKGIVSNPRCTEIIASIVQLSDSLGVKVLAEYVSDESIRRKLETVGCLLYQGWYYSPAIPLEELGCLLDKNLIN